MYIIYKTTCKINGKIYVGQHKTEVVDDGYLGSGKLIRRAISKYGVDNFTREVLEIVDTPDEAREREEFYIQLHESTNLDIGYNITKYAWGGQPITEEARQKISDKLKGRRLSEETKLKLSEPKPPRSQEHRENSSKSRKGKKWYHNPATNESRCFSVDDVIPNDWVKGRPKHHLANTQTEEANAKRSEKLKGREKSIDTRSKISNTLLGHEVSSETREKLRLHYEKTSKYSKDPKHQTD